MPPSIAARHQIRLKDQSGSVVAIFDNFKSLKVTRVVNDVGSFTITFVDNDDPRFDMFETDGQFELWRSVPGCDLAWYREFSGMIRRFVRSVKEDGSKEFIASGFDYNHLLARRVIAYKDGTVFSVKDDYAEDCMKEFVEENCGPSANDVSRIRNGVFTGFTVEAESAAHDETPEWSGSVSFQNLLDVLQEVSNFSLGGVPTTRAVYFGVEDNGVAQFIFRTYLDQPGTDRTSTVFFGIALGNMASLDLDIDRSTEANAVIVLGQGEGSTRTVIARENSTDGDDSAWNDIEISRPASLNEFSYQLEDFGDSLLQENQKRELFNTKPLQTPSTLYGKHYFLGDLVTVRHGTTDYSKMIIKVDISAEPSKGEDVDIDFEDISR